MLGKVNPVKDVSLEVRKYFGVLGTPKTPTGPFAVSVVSKLT